MPTTSKVAKNTSAKTPTKKSSASPKGSARKAAVAKDAIELLKDDHAAVKKLFKRYPKLDSATEKKTLATKICGMLEVHTEIEEEIFYPAVRPVIHADDMMDEAEVEHAGAKDLIAQIKSEEPDDDKYDAKVKVLSEYIDHHVEEEEQPGGMFAKARRAKVDLLGLGAALKQRSDVLKAQKGLA